MFKVKVEMIIYVTWSYGDIRRDCLPYQREPKRTKIGLIIPSWPYRAAETDIETLKGPKSLYLFAINIINRLQIKINYHQFYQRFFTERLKHVSRIPQSTQIEMEHNRLILNPTKFICEIFQGATNRKTRIDNDGSNKCASIRSSSAIAIS